MILRRVTNVHFSVAMIAECQTLHSYCLPTYFSSKHYGRGLDLKFALQWLCPMLVQGLVWNFCISWNVSSLCLGKFDLFTNVLQWNWLCWGLTTRQPLWVILSLPEKGRKEIVRDERGGQEKEEQWNCGIWSLEETKASSIQVFFYASVTKSGYCITYPCPCRLVCASICVCHTSFIECLTGAILQFLKQQKGENACRKYIMINIYQRMLPDPAGIESATSWYQ